MGSIVEVGLANAAMVAGLAVVVGGFGLICRKPALIHSLWILVLLKLLTPPLVSVPLPTLSWSEPAPQEVQYVFLEALPDDAVFEQVELPAELAFTKPAEPAVSWRTLGLCGWLAGSLAWLVVTAVRVGRFREVVRDADLAPAELQFRVEDLADRIGLAHPPEVRVVSGVISPMVWAFFGPAKLILPTDLWDRLTDEQKTTLLVHELAHLKRRDHWVRHLELLATAFYWWHPALWWARRSLREAEEECCDAWVVWAMPKSNKMYASALLEAVDFLCEAKCHSLPLGASGAGPVKPLKRRLLMILRGMTPKSLSLTGRLAVLGLASILLPILPSTTSAQQSADVKQDGVQKVYTITNGNTLAIIGDDEKGDKGDKKPLTLKFQIMKRGDAGEEILVIGEDGKVVTENIVGEDAMVMTKGHSFPVKVNVGVGAVGSDGNKTINFVTTTDSESKSDDKPDLTPEKKAEIEKARKEVAEAQEKLQVALKKLVELEGKNAQAQVRMMVVSGDKLVADQLAKAKDMKLDAEKQVQNLKLRIQRDAKDIKQQAEKDAVKAREELRGYTIRPDVPPTAAAPAQPARPATPDRPTAPRPARRAGEEVERRTGDQDRRMEAIEKRLEKLLDELEALKKKDDVKAVDPTRP